MGILSQRIWLRSYKVDSEEFESIGNGMEHIPANILYGELSVIAPVTLEII